MPVSSRKQLRQRLGVNQLHDTFVSTHIGSLPALTGSAFFIDTTVADAAATGEGLGGRPWLKNQGYTYRAASFNVFSGAYVTLQAAQSGGIASGSEYERHDLISPDDKDRAIDWAVNRVWIRQELALNSVDGAMFYSVGYDFGQIFDWWIISNPTGSLDRMKASIDSKPQIRVTGSGRELRLPYGLQASQQLIIDTEVRATLGAADAATINIPSEAAILYGAESQCWEMLAKRAPAQERKAYLMNAQRAAGAYSRLSQRFQPQIDKRIGFDDVV